MEDREGRVFVKRVEGLTFAHTHMVVEERTPILERARELAATLGDAVAGPPLVVQRWGAVEGALDVDVGYPVGTPVEAEGISLRELPAAELICAEHRGDFDNVRETYLLVYAEMRARGVVPATTSREVLHHIDDGDPSASVVEVQWHVHDWPGLLARGVEEVLSPTARDAVMEGVDGLGLGSSREDRFEWVMAALRRLDGIADEEQRYWAVSRCADCYPVWRLEELREVYERTGSVDEVLEAMTGDTEWYSTPRREGSLIYHTKVPYDREAWEGAGDRASRRRAYCHCALIQDRLDEVPPTYCYCGTGWVRQVWEHVLGRSVRVEVLKSLPAGDDECQFLIHLPEGAVD